MIHHYLAPRNYMSVDSPLEPEGVDYHQTVVVTRGSLDVSSGKLNGDKINPRCTQTCVSFLSKGISFPRSVRMLVQVQSALIISSLIILLIQKFLKRLSLVKYLIWYKLYHSLYHIVYMICNISHVTYELEYRTGCDEHQSWNR